MKKTTKNKLSISKMTIASLHKNVQQQVMGGNHPASSVCDQPDTFTSNQTGPSMSDVLQTMIQC
ncbi:MAG: hypothetical protein ACI9Y7_000589 [Dokdonia sp.]|jgi:hypothetical protein